MIDDALRSGGRGWCSTILSSITDAVVAADVEGRVTFMNPTAEAITGWSNEEAGGRPLRDILRIFDEASGRPIHLPAVEAMGAGEVADLPEPIHLVGKGG